MQNNIIIDRILNIPIEFKNTNKPKITKYPYSIRNFLGVKNIIPHYVNVRAGFLLENYINSIIDCIDGWHKLQIATAKQIDTCFINHNKKIILYTEDKSNINLDSEKQQATARKIENILSAIKSYVTKNNLNGYKIITGILCPTNVSDDVGNINGIQVFSLKQFLSVIDDSLFDDSNILVIADNLKAKLNDAIKNINLD